MSAAEWTGSAGVGLLLVAFFLNLVGYLRRDSWSYLAMNAVGAGVACWASYLIGFFPFVVLEGTWSVFALVKLVGKLLGRP